MYAHRVDVFHITHHNGVVVFVAHHLVFNFFEASDGFFNKTLGYRRIFQTETRDFLQFVIVMRDSAACATHGKGRTYNHRIPYVMGKFQSALNGVYDVGIRYRFVEFAHQFAEKIAVFRLVDG